MFSTSVDVSTLSPEDKKIYEEIEAKFLSFKLKKYIVKVIQEARLVHPSILEMPEAPEEMDMKAAYSKFIEHLHSGNWVTAMAETSHVIYLDPEETKITAEQILKYQLVLGSSKGNNIQDFRIIGVEFVGDVFAHELMDKNKLQDSINNAFTDRIERMKEEVKVNKPERMN